MTYLLDALPHRLPHSLGLAAITLSLVVSPTPAVLAQDAPAFEGSTTVIVVEVPVNVHVDGEAVRGLDRDDFVVREGRRERPLVGFEVIDLEAVSAPGRPEAAAEREDVPIAARRHFLLLFDLTSGGLAGLGGARDLVESGLHPTDLVGVGFYGRSGAGLLLGFTPDRRQVHAVLDRLAGGAGGVPRENEARTVGDETESASLFRDPLRLVPDTQAIDIAREAMDLAGRNAEVLFDMDRANVQQGRARARAEVQRFADSLGAVADATAGLDGRKFLVLFSAGFDEDLFFEEEILERRSLLDSREGATSLRDLQGMTEKFRRAGWTIQSVDAGGLGRDLTGGTSLSLMARETGGETYRNFNDLGQAMDQMLGKTSVTYLLAFQADDVRLDGEFHPIEVKLVNGPRGARVLHRPGYFAPRPLDEEAEIDPEAAAVEAMAGTFSVAEQLLSGDTGGDVAAETLVASFREPNEEKSGARVTAWIDVSGTDLLAVHPSPEMAVEVYAYVLDATGGVVDFTTRTLNLELAKVGERLRRGGLRLYADFSLPPGEHDLRVLVRNPQTGRYALDRVPFSVPDLSADTSALLPPFFLDDEVFQEGSEALVVREQPAAGEADFYPYLVGDGEIFVPAIAPRVDGDTPRVVLMGYDLAREGLVLDATIYDVTTDPTGERLEGDRLRVVGRSDTTDAGLDRLYLAFDPKGLAEGSYELRASIRDPETGFSQTVASPFRVGE